MSSKVFLIVCCCVGMTLGVPIDPTPSKTWCCTSDACFKKCGYFQTRYNELFPFECQKRDSVDECITCIKDGMCDMMFLDGGEIFRQRKSITVVGCEDYGDGDASYYAVVVVKNNAASSISMFNLTGTKSCHTGVGKTSGWNTPMGWLARRANKLDNDGKLLLIDPFKSSCAPGARDEKYLDFLPENYDPDKWCELCEGDGQGNHVCERDSDELFYGYDGAFQCMKQGRGNVAFVKHVTVPVDEHDDFQLLCPDGSRAHPSDWRNCNLARVPAHGLVMKKGSTLSDVGNVIQVLNNALSGFDEGEKKTNLLWKKSAKSFMGPFVQTALKFLGTEYFCNMMALTGAPPLPQCLPA